MRNSLLRAGRHAGSARRTAHSSLPGSRAGQNASRLDRWIAGGWMVLFAWLYFNPFVAFDTRVSLTVPLLATLSVLLTARALRVNAEEETIPQPGTAPVAMAA